MPQRVYALLGIELGALCVLRPQSSIPSLPECDLKQTAILNLPLQEEESLKYRKACRARSAAKAWGGSRGSVFFHLLVSLVYSYQLVSPGCHGTASESYHHLLLPISSSVRERQRAACKPPGSRGPGSATVRPSFSSPPGTPFSSMHRALQPFRVTVSTLQYRIPVTPELSSGA